MTARSKQNLFVGLICLMAFAPALAGFALRQYFLDTNHIGRSAFILQDLEIEHRKVNGLLYQVQGFENVDPKEIETAARNGLTACRSAADADWYDHDHRYQTLKNTVLDYCELSKARLNLFGDYDRETQGLVDAMEAFPKYVRTFDTDKNEDLIENVEREVMAYAVRPSHDADFGIRGELAKLPGEKYAKFKTFAISILMHSNHRATLIETLTDPAPLNLLAKAKQLHFDAVVEHDVRGTLAREVLIYISFGFAIIILFVYWNLQKTGNKLANLNRTLEEKVGARTSELQTALSQLSEQQSYLAQKAKFSALGEMAGGIAHEINTPLAAISLTAELLAADAEELQNHRLAEGLTTISNIVERISKIVQGLKRFARSEDGTVRTPTAVSQVIEDTLMLCSEKIKVRGVRLSIDAGAGAAHSRINCSPEQISQVLINLLNNSLDAVETQPQARKWIRIETSDSNGVFRMSISDGGDEIPESVREKLMQPFFTTKQIGKGTGLGLSISKGIMASHLGTLEFDATKTETTFVMTMPSLPLTDGVALDREEKTHDFAIAR